MEIKQLCLSNNPNQAIISLHGWKGNAFSMEPIAKIFKFPDTKWLFPQAPYPIKDLTNLNKKKLPTKYSWSNHTVRDKETPKKKFVEKSIAIIEKCINILENEGLNKNKIFILGFSQGAIFSLWFIINQKYSIGGCISICGGFDKTKTFFKKNFQSKSKATPILLIHGEKDNIIHPEESKNTYKLFKESGFNIELKLFPSAHKVPLKAKTLIWNFITKNKKNIHSYTIGYEH